MNIKTYYQELKVPDPQSEFRARVIMECKISIETFYRWMREPEQIPYLAKEKIAVIAEQEITDLFPETIS